MPELSRQELAEQYGWALSVLRSSYELWQLFQKAVSHQWEPGKFASELRNTRWFRRHSEAWRKNEILKRTDPGEYRARRAQLGATLRDQASAMGAVLSTKQLSKMMTNIMSFGWSDAEIRNSLADYVKWSNGRLLGEAGTNASSLRATARANGYKLSNTVLDDWARAIARGDRQVADYQTYIRQQAAKMFPAFKDELNAGMDALDVASPYVNAMAQNWEINPNEITLFDPTLRKALTTVDPATGKPTAMGLYDFEVMLRKDARWGQTKNAQDQATALTHDLLRQFGVSV